GWTPPVQNSFPGGRLAGLRARRAGFLDGDERVAELFDPFALVLAHEPDAPRERVGSRTGDAGADERVEGLAFSHPKAGHHRHGERRERLLLVTAPRAPRDLAAGPALGFVGDAHALLARFLTEALDSS